MKSPLLKDRYSTEEAKALQMKYKSEIQKESFEKLNIRDLEKIKFIVGVDISYYSNKNQEFGVACAVLWDIKEKKVIEKVFAEDEIHFPYVAGYLGFRECRLFSKAILKLKENYDLIMCDGHGKIHPRRFGEAVQLGVALNAPTIGVAKSPFIGYSEWERMERRKGNKTPIWDNNPPQMNSGKRELLGYAICLRNGSKPVFVSEGNKVNIDLALKITLKTSNEHHRLPEPLFLADFYSRQKLPNNK